MEFRITHSLLARFMCVFRKYVIWNHSKRELKIKPQEFFKVSPRKGATYLAIR